MRDSLIPDAYILAFHTVSIKQQRSGGKKGINLSDAVVTADFLRICHWCRRGPTALLPLYTGHHFTGPPSRGFLLSLQPVFLFRRQPRLRHFVRLGQSVPLDEEAHKQAKCCDANEEDPHLSQASHIDGSDRVSTWFCESLYNGCTGTCTTTTDLVPDLLIRRRYQGRLAFFHPVLEDDTADDNGDGGTDVASERKSRRGSRDIPWSHMCLKGDKRCLKVRPNSNTGYDLEGDDATPGTTDRKVDEETEAKSHEEQPEPNRWEVVPGFLNYGADKGGGEGERNDKGEKVNPT